MTDQLTDDQINEFKEAFFFPNAVESYTISPTNGAFTIQLTHPCYVKFDDQTIYYNKNIEGKLTYGSVSSVSGIQSKQIFLWLSVTDMDMDSSSGMLEFHVGALSKKLPAKSKLVHINPTFI